jgi:hypothetical protein
MLQVGRLRVRFSLRSLEFSVGPFFPASPGPGVDSPSDVNYYQVPSSGIALRGVQFPDCVVPSNRMMKDALFSDVTPCGPCTNRRFGGT